MNCSDRNGPITGYYLTYTNITSNTSYTVNITGGYNTLYNLTGLIPYTNYTVIVAPHNNGVGPPSEALIQETDQSSELVVSVLAYFYDLNTDPGVISDLISTNISTESISISWIPPTTPNGIITVYEIRYREFTSTGPYNITNTTNTQYSIVGLIPNTSYTIGVRAYTSVGPGGWINFYFNTRAIRKLSVLSASFSSSLTLDNTCNTTSVSVSSGKAHCTIHHLHYYYYYYRAVYQSISYWSLCCTDSINSIYSGQHCTRDKLVLQTI